MYLDHGPSPAYVLQQKSSRSREMVQQELNYLRSNYNDCNANIVNWRLNMIDCIHVYCTILMLLMQPSMSERLQTHCVHTIVIVILKVTVLDNSQEQEMGLLQKE